MAKTKTKKQFDAIQLCDGMSMMQLIRAVTIMPSGAVLRLPVVAESKGGKAIRLRVEFVVEDRPWMQQPGNK